MCVCLEDRQKQIRLCRAVFGSVIAAVLFGGGVAVLQWSDQEHLHRFAAPSLLFSGQVAVGTFWISLLLFYSLLVHRSPARLRAEREARRAQEALAGRLTLARGYRPRR